MNCEVCGLLNENYTENGFRKHKVTQQHVTNLILANCKKNKNKYTTNRSGCGIKLFTTVRTDGQPTDGGDVIDGDGKVRVVTKANNKVSFTYDIENCMNGESALVVGVLMPHSPQFQMTNPFVYDGKPYVLDKKTSIKGKVVVNFKSKNAGHYEMPIIFIFHKERQKKEVIIIRYMAIEVKQKAFVYPHLRTNYTNKKINYWKNPTELIQSPREILNENIYEIPNMLKVILSRGLDDKLWEHLNHLLSPDELLYFRKSLANTRLIFKNRATEQNYISYFRHLLWWEEIAAPVDENDNNCITGVKLFTSPDDDGYLFEVDGLSERRPPVLRGDMILIRHSQHPDVLYESFVKDITNSQIQVTGLDDRFSVSDSAKDLFDVLLCASRAPMQRLHEAVSRVHASGHTCRVFPPSEPTPRTPPPHIPRFYNKLIKYNAEQKSAVKHIVSGTSGRCPYILYGLPGTGKTTTVVEAIIQVVVANPRNRVLVCTASDTVADHIAVMLQQYSQELNIDNFMFRANSRTRDWSIMPSVLAPVSNGTSCESSYSLSNVVAASYRVLVMTLSHSAKYALPSNQEEHMLQMTHLFIDEAGQASEPATLVPICGLLAPSGQLVLAGDPKQLEPECVSHEARRRGLGISLMQRLMMAHNHMYSFDPTYMTILLKNFRSHPHILKIPNSMFYGNCLQTLADPDPLTKVSLLGLPGGKRSIVFHAVQSQEQETGTSASLCNTMELDVLKKYIHALIEVHGVAQEDIGIVTPYIRQVQRMQSWLNENYSKIQVGTVEAFQGKEKRVILVSTVRTSSRLVDGDANYDLRSLVDENKFNVILTRAKAKLILVGNPEYLTKDPRWRVYMELCTKYNSYHDTWIQQLPRKYKFHSEIIKRLENFHITKQLKKKLKKKIKY